jgi:hypothetical protein
MPRPRRDISRRSRAASATVVPFEQPSSRKRGASRPRPGDRHQSGIPSGEGPRKRIGEGYGGGRPPYSPSAGPIPVKFHSYARVAVHTEPFCGTLGSKPRGTCSPIPSGLGFRSRSQEASVCLNFERFKRWRLPIPGTVKLWESPGRAGGLLVIIIKITFSSCNKQPNYPPTTTPGWRPEKYATPYPWRGAPHVQNDRDSKRCPDGFSKISPKI